MSTGPKELFRGFRCARPGEPPFHTELWTVETGVLVYSYGPAGCIRFNAHRGLDPREAEDLLRLAIHDEFHAEIRAEYGPEG